MEKYKHGKITKVTLKHQSLFLFSGVVYYNEVLHSKYCNNWMLFFFFEGFGIYFQIKLTIYGSVFYLRFIRMNELDFYSARGSSSKIPILRNL
jgi:hypothetical protein